MDSNLHAFDCTLERPFFFLLLSLSMTSLAVYTYDVPLCLLYRVRCGIMRPDFATRPTSVITRIWRRPKTRGSYLFLLNRYFGFFGGVTVTVLNFCAMPRDT